MHLENCGEKFLSSKSIIVQLPHQKDKNTGLNGVTTRCNLTNFIQVDITWFPFDEQSCPLKFGTWTTHSAMVNLSLGKSDTVELMILSSQVGQEWYHGINHSPCLPTQSPMFFQIHSKGYSCALHLKKRITAFRA
jgi:hypothetical protein